MAVKVVNLPLYPDAFYSYAVSIERVSYFIKFRYNTRTGKWYFDLFTRDNQPVLVGQAIVPEYPITFDYVNPYSGFFWLGPLPDVDPEKSKAYPRDIHKYYSFSYYYYKEE